MEDVVTYEQAVKLQKRGFDWEVNHYYYFGKELFENLSDYSDEDIANGDDTSYEDFNILGIPEVFCSAPTLAQAAKWLREVKGLFIDVWLNAGGYNWSIDKCSSLDNYGTFVAKHDEESGDDEDSGMFTTYEKALSSGIDAALKLIKAINYERWTL